jgi:hypothetical protein
MTILTSIQSPEDAINAALIRIGFTRRIDQIYEGTPAARAAVLIYGQTRDDILRTGDYRFAVRQAALVKLKAAPAGGYSPMTPWSAAQYPAVPWIYSYAYPIDCLRLLSLRTAPMIVPVSSPRAVTWSIDNDNSYTPPQKVILTNLGGALATYTARVTDLALWDAAAVEALIDALATNLAPALANLDSQKIEEAAEARAANTAEHLEG